MISFRKIPTQDKDLQLVQDGIQNALSQIQGSPFIGGNLLPGVVLASGSNNAVPHKLGRVPQVWVLCGQNANSTVWATSSDSTLLNLSCSAACTVTLWVN